MNVIRLQVKGGCVYVLFAGDVSLACQMRVSLGGRSDPARVEAEGGLAGRQDQAFWQRFGGEVGEGEFGQMI